MSFWNVFHCFWVVLEKLGLHLCALFYSLCHKLSLHTVWVLCYRVYWIINSTLFLSVLKKPQLFSALSQFCHLVLHSFEVIYESFLHLKNMISVCKNHTACLPLIFSHIDNLFFKYFQLLRQVWTCVSSLVFLPILAINFTNNQNLCHFQVVTHWVWWERAGNSHQIF